MICWILSPFILIFLLLIAGGIFYLIGWIIKECTRSPSEGIIETILTGVSILILLSALVFGGYFVLRGGHDLACMLIH